jgi:hypothetical protein
MSGISRYIETEGLVIAQGWEESELVMVNRGRVSSFFFFWWD